MGSCRRPAGERRIELGIRERRAVATRQSAEVLRPKTGPQDDKVFGAFPGQDGTFSAALIFKAMKNPPAGFREGFQLVRLVMRELRWPLESPWGP